MSLPRARTAVMHHDQREPRALLASPPPFPNSNLIQLDDRCPLLLCALELVIVTIKASTNTNTAVSFQTRAMLYFCVVFF